jgi:hypothetical protein
MNVNIGISRLNPSELAYILHTLFAIHMDGMIGCLMKPKKYFFFVKKLPPYTPVGFDLTTHNSTGGHDSTM